jgi:hypothetical protein
MQEGKQIPLVLLSLSSLCLILLSCHSFVALLHCPSRRPINVGWESAATGFYDGRYELGSSAGRQMGKRTGVESFLIGPTASRWRER